MGNSRAGPQAFPERKAHEVAVAVHDRSLARHRDNPSDQTFWPIELGSTLFPAPPSAWATSSASTRLTHLDLEEFRRQELEKWCILQAAEHFAAQGLRIDDASRLKLAKAVAVAAAVQRASLTLTQFASGELEHGSNGRPYQLSSTRVGSPSSALAGKISFDELVKGWVAEKRSAEKTIYECRRVVRQFTTFVGHDDAGRLTADDVVAWKGTLIEGVFELRPSAMQSSHRFEPSCSGWSTSAGCQAIRLSASPSASNPSRQKRGVASPMRRPLTCKAATKEKDPVRRWVPWLCATLAPACRRCAS